MSRQIYDKTVREILIDYSKRSEEIFSKQDVLSYFKENYPLIKKNTITAHLIRLSANCKNRVNYHLRNDGSDDIFFKIDSSNFRIYNQKKDGKPIYK